jgi:hypothetical protein
MQSMNLGFTEAAHLTALIKGILRDHATVDLEQSYGHQHWHQWKRHLGLLDGPLAIATASDWVRHRVLRIVASLPASAEELSDLLNGLGIIFR